MLMQAASVCELVSDGLFKKGRPDKRVVADGAQLHEGVVDALEGFGCNAAIARLHLPFYQAAQRRLIS